MNDRVGQQFGNYRLIRLLGRGSFAEVYLGEHIYLKTSAAVKLLHRSLTDEDAERFLAEARTLARLKHPYIVSVLDFDMEQTTPVLVMQYAPKGTLRQRFPQGSRLSLATTAMYVKQAAEALQYAYKRGVIHRDVKPDNMLLISDRNLLLSDFGIALLAPSPTLLSTQAMAGTPSYTAPEQLRGKPTFASDQYSLAVVVYEWLCGVRPFEGVRWEVVQKHMFATPLPLRTHNPRIPVAVEAVVLKALAKDHRQRFADVQTFAEAFEQACLPHVNENQEDTQPLLAIPPRTIPSVPVPVDQPELVSSEPQLPRRIFLTASPADTHFAASLMKDLSMRGIESSNDNMSTLDPGVNQEDALRTAMRSSSCVLVVISPHTRSSRIIGEHLRMAGMYQRRLLFVWAAGEGLIQVLLEAAGYGVDIDVIDARETRYPTAIDEIVACINKDISAPSPQKPAQPLQEARNPYKGLQAFTERDVKDFFGRTALVEELVKSLQHTLNRGQARLLAVVGPSGSGKSSVVRAGLLPQLRGGALPGSAHWIYLDPVVPEKRPIESLALALEPHLQHKSIKTIREDLRDDSLRGLHLLATRLLQLQNGTATRDGSQRGRHRLATRLIRPREARVVLLIDQFEEIFSQSVAEQERQQMIDLLLTAATEPGGPVVLLLTLRADFYDRPMHYPALSRLLQEHTIPVLPMDLQELRAVIEEPAALPDVQLIFEGNLVGDLLFETYGQAGALPLLEFTLDELFRQRIGHWITQRAYEQMGGVKGALAKHAESTYASLPSDEHRSFAQVLFIRLVNPGVTDQDTTRRRATLSELSLADAKQTALLREVTDTFIEARLLTTNEHAGITTVEVSHEALIREWARLSNWLREGREDISFQQSISGDVDTWEQRGRPRDRLYHGSQLKEARAWARRSKPSEQETAFLRASTLRQMRYAVSVIVVFLLLFTSVGAAVGLYFLIPPTPPDPRLVTNLRDDGSSGSLRWAIESTKPGSTIKFAPDVRGTIWLKSGDLVFSKSLTIQGPGASTLTISGGNTGSVVQVLDGKSVTMYDMSFKDSDTGKKNFGFLDNQGTLKLINTTISDNTSSGTGGGIFNENTLTLINSTVSNNSAQHGGGIYNYGGRLTVINSTISGNKAVAQDASGGGIYDYGQLILTNSTVSGNEAFDTGGGITVFGGQAAITFCTIYDNTAQNDGGGLSIQDFQTQQSHVEMGSSIVAGNNAPVEADSAGIFTSGGYNLIQEVSQASLLQGNFSSLDLIGRSSGVDPLRNNGGLTRTHALAPGSPAIDQIPLKVCQVEAIFSRSSKAYTDQRGVKRPQGSACDIGAYEK
jgi:serine/threonine protein kinase